MSGRPAPGRTPRLVRLRPEWDAFRSVARDLLQLGYEPADVIWAETGVQQGDLDLLEDLERPGAPPLSRFAPGAREGPASTARVPRRFLELGERVASHRDPPGWPLLYRALWRINAGERQLLDDAADPEVVALTTMDRAVRRDCHKMKAFVRFRSVADPEGERFVSWFEPRHRIVRLVAPFFVDRFPSMRWSILTPDECLHWDGEELSFTEGMIRREAPTEDALESLWLTYYGSTFNPARLRLRAMAAEMPRYYWRNLPEAASIPGLVRETPARLRAMIETAAAAAERAETGLGAAPGPDDSLDLRLPLGDEARPAPRPEPLPEQKVIAIPGVRIGVAGWDYPDWAGAVYPEHRGEVDRLRWVGSLVDLIEVNSTFYRPASSKTTRSWIERTTDLSHLKFSAKMPREITHAAGPWKNAPAAAMRAGMLPLLKAGRLLSLLVQFPWSFRNTPDHRQRLERILDEFADFPLHVEVRHVSWDDATVRQWLRGRHAGLVSIDQPLFRDSLEPSAEATSRSAYLRLHGRNHANWFREDASRDERYDYSYSREELEPWVQRAADLADREDVDEVSVVFNNHFRGQAMDNAREFRRLLLERDPDKVQISGTR